MKTKGILTVILCFILSMGLHAQSPGGIGKTDMSLWVRGDFGVTNSGTLSWSDDSGLGNNAIQPDSEAQAIQNSTMNFNSTFTFDGNSDRFAITNKNYTSNESLSQLYTFVVYKTGFSNNSFNSNWSFLDYDRSETFNFYVHGNGRLAMSYQSGGTQDLVANTVSNDNKAHLGTFIFDNSLVDESIMRLDGDIDYEDDITSNAILTSANRFGFIGDGSEANSENGATNDIYYDGEIAEIIFYEQNTLSLTDIQKIESYLAVKYGITLNQSFGSYVNSSNTPIWNNLTYWNDVAGIINDSSLGSINQKVAKSSDEDELIVSTDNDFNTLNNDAGRTALPLGSSLLFGNNDGNIGGLEVFDAINNEFILERKWYFEEVAETGTVYLAIPKTLFSGESVDLIVSTDDTFDNTDTRLALTEGTSHFYTTINITSGDRISFVVGDLYAPGGVSGAKLWYRADLGITQSGSNVSTVSDQSGSGNNASQPNSANQPSNASLMNFNPTLTFDGGNDRLPIQNINYTSSDALSQVYIWTVYATTFSNTSDVAESFDNTNWAFLDFDRSEYFNTSVTGDGRLGFYYHPEGSTIVDIKATTVTNNGEPYIGGFSFNLNEVNESTIRLNGDVELNEDRTNTALGSDETRFGFVGDGSEASTFNGTGNNSYYSGDISEIVYFENEVLDDSKIETIESYLAFKYGITLNQDTPTNYYASDWDGISGTIMRNATDNINYNNDIAGIGLDVDSDLDQRISKSQNNDALIAFALDDDFTTANNSISRTTAHSSDKSFMSWGNNNEALTWSPLESSTCNVQLLDRVWRIDEVGTVGTVYIALPDNSSSEDTKLPAGITNLNLVTKLANADFSTGASLIPLTLNGTNWELPSGTDFTDGTYFTFQINSIEKTAVGTDWNTSTDWSPIGVPAPRENVTIPFGINMIIEPASAVEVNAVTLEAGSSLTIDSGATLTTSCKLSLESTSTSYSSLILDGVVNGEIEYNRHINIYAGSGNSTANNDLVSAPLVGQTFGDFRMANSNIVSGTIGGNPAFLFGPFNSSSNVYENYAPGDDGLTLDAGVGYRTGSTDNGTYTFSGNVETATVTNPVVSNSQIVWNLVGNPYPSYLRVQEFLNNSSNQLIIDSGDAFGIYGYDGTALNGWTIYNLSNTTSTTTITPGQGFFIAVAPNVTDNLTFTPTMRSTGDGDDFIVGRDGDNSNLLTYLRLKTYTLNDNYKTDFYFNANSTKGLDVGYDAITWNASVANFSLYSNLVENNTGRPLAIQSLNITDLDNVTIPLGVHSDSGIPITFSIDSSTLPSGTKVYLQDVVQNTNTLLTTNSYTFTPNIDLSGVGRFYLQISNDNLLSNNNNKYNALEIFNNPNSRTLVLNGLLRTNASISLFDMQGRLIITKALQSNWSYQNIEFNDLISGVYVAKINSGNFSKTQKVIFSEN